MVNFEPGNPNLENIVNLLGIRSTFNLFVANAPMS